MTDQLDFDVDYKVLIKEKLLDAYEKNPLILEKILQMRAKANLSVRTNRGDCISFFSRDYLAGIIVCLCPEIINFIATALDFNGDLNSVFETIGLNFDPRPELEKRAEARRLVQEATLAQENNIIGLLAEDPEYRAVHEGLEEVRTQINQQEKANNHTLPCEE